MKTWSINFYNPGTGEMEAMTVEAHSVIFEPEGGTARFMVRQDGETIVLAVFTQVSTLQLTAQ